MTTAVEQKQIYIVISQTGTVLSRILKMITGAEYNHASLSLSPNLDAMYSFGRKNPYNPFIGGFVLESPHTGTFKRFHKTKALVMAVDISEETHNAINEAIEKMLAERKKYHYNYLGVLLAAIHINHKRANYYYCSEFVKHILEEFEIEGSKELNPIVHPIHFLKLPHTPIYCGKLKDYTFPSN